MVYLISGSLSIAGTVFGVMGSLALSMYSIYTKRVLPYVNQQIWLLSYYNNVYSCFLFLPLIILNKELPVILNFENLADAKFWLFMTGGGLCGFAIGFVTALQIQVQFHILQFLALFRFRDYMCHLFQLVLYFICVSSC
jgi:GDP-fucose transporter C1